MHDLFLIFFRSSENRSGTPYLSGCVLLCSRCHAALHTGRVICRNEHEDGEIHYRWHDAEMCSYCFLKIHPELIEQKARDKSAQRRRKVQARQAKAHPCKYRGLSQKCKRRPGEVCTFTAKKALTKCRHFRPKDRPKEMKG